MEDLLRCISEVLLLQVWGEVHTQLCPKAALGILKWLPKATWQSLGSEQGCWETGHSLPLLGEPEEVPGELGRAVAS